MDELNEIFAAKAIEWAKQKVPYQHRGTTRGGCDCTGLLIGIARELGFLKTYKLRKYPPDWNLHAGAGNQVIDGLSKIGVEIPNSQAKIGDVAVMVFGRCPAHCGMIINNKLMIVHSLSTNRCCTFGMLKNSMWEKRWLTTFRLQEEKLKAYS